MAWEDIFDPVQDTFWYSQNSETYKLRAYITGVTTTTIMNFFDVICYEELSGEIASNLMFQLPFEYKPKSIGNTSCEIEIIRNNLPYRIGFSNILVNPKMESFLDNNCYVRIGRPLFDDSINRYKVTIDYQESSQYSFWYDLAYSIDKEYIVNFKDIEYAKRTGQFPPNMIGLTETASQAIERASDNILDTLGLNFLAGGEIDISKVIRFVIILVILGLVVNILMGVFRR